MCEKGDILWIVYSGLEQRVSCRADKGDASANFHADKKACVSTDSQDRVSSSANGTAYYSWADF